MHIAHHVPPVLESHRLTSLLLFLVLCGVFLILTLTEIRKSDSLQSSLRSGIWRWDMF